MKGSAGSKRARLLPSGGPIIPAMPEKARTNPTAVPARAWLAFSLCGVGGLLAGLLGIGGGIVMVPVLHLMLGLSFKGATATSNFMMGLTALPALLGFAGRGELDLRLAVPLAVGVLAGASLGAWSLPRIGTRVLKGAFALVLALVALEMARRGVGAW